jgi:GNAT superfamily N-acetyltransferase
MGGLVMRPFEDRDWPDMVRFYEQFYRPGYIFTKRAFFDWNFAPPFRPDDRSGQRLILDGDKIICILGVFGGWPLQVGGRRVSAQSNNNLFLDPDYRGRRLGHELFASAVRETPYNLISGYNPRTFSMYERLGTIRHWRMRRFSRSLDADAVARLIRQYPGFEALAPAQQDDALRQVRDSGAAWPAAAEPLERVVRFGEEWEAAWESIRKECGFTTWRSAQFLNWRYIDYPFPLYTCHVARRNGRITGLVVLRLETPPCGAILRIVDLVALPEARRGLLAAVEQAARAQGAILVDYVFSGAMDFPLLAEAGYRELQGPTGETLLPMDLNPIRYRDAIRALVIFADPNDPACAEIESGRYYVVKGDADQDRAN